jgi:hypothetical protein
LPHCYYWQSYRYQYFHRMILLDQYHWKTIGYSCLFQYLPVVFWKAKYHMIVLLFVRHFWYGYETKADVWDFCEFITRLVVLLLLDVCKEKECTCVQSIKLITMNENKDRTNMDNLILLTFPCSWRQQHRRRRIWHDSDHLFLFCFLFIADSLCCLLKHTLYLTGRWLYCGTEYWSMDYSVLRTPVLCTKDILKYWTVNGDSTRTTTYPW